MVPPRSSQVFSADAARAISTASARVEVDNISSWNARWQMLSGAKKNIDTTYFSLDDDVFGMAFLGHLLKKQREGVTVRLMLDAMADPLGKSFKVWGRDHLSQMVRDGVDVRIYNPVNTRFFRAMSAAGYAQNHDKILVVDGQTGITGGRNIGGAYFSDPKDVPTAWRDTDVVLEGQGAAKGLTEAFDAEWSSDRNIASPVGEGFLKTPREVELVGAYVLMDLWMNRTPLSSAVKDILRRDAHARARRVDDLVEQALARLPAEGVTAKPSLDAVDQLKKMAEELVRNPELAGGAHRKTAPTRHNVDTAVIDRTSARVQAHDDFAKALMQTADNAKKRLLIQNPYVVLTKPMLEALERAAKRGVQITIVTNSPASTDSALTQAFFLHDWPEVIARLDKSRLFVFAGERKMHAKVAVADDDVSLVSTYNLDMLSSEINGEVGSLMVSKEVAQDVERSIEEDLADPANKVQEYTIARDAHGRALLNDAGKPTVVRGPDFHVSSTTMLGYRAAGALADVARRVIPGLQSMLHR